MLYSHRKYLNQDAKNMLCDAMVLSPLNYCDVIYGPCLTGHDSNRIQKLQKCCLRLIYGIRRRERITYKLQDANWLNMYSRRVLHSAIFFYKILKKESPRYLVEKVRYRNQVHNRNLRCDHILVTPRHNKEFFKKSFAYNIANIINKFQIVDFSTPIASVKKGIKTRLFQSQLL